jgi:serine/threonine-protein kinase
VKVTDFGIARAIGGGNTDNLTQTGSVMGTATYFSPEQAQGLPVDPRSDLYSLGIVLYEMLCGRPPFSGDSPIAIAYQHVQGSATPPRQINPDIPPALEAITMKLLAKNPANRYATAEELRADLRRFREGQPVAAESILPGPVAVGVAAGAGAATAPVAEATNVLPTARVGPAPAGPGGPVDPTAVGGPVYPAGPLYEPPRRNGVFIGVLVVLLALLGVLLYFFARTVLDSDSGGAATIEVPDVHDQLQAQAEALLQKDGFVPKSTFEANAQVDPGKVIRQDPVGGAKAAKGSTVNLFISQPAQQLTVPDLKGQTEEEARATLQNAGFTASPKRQTQPVTDPSQNGKVIGQDPVAFTKVPKDQAVTFTIGAGPSQVSLPDVAGQTPDQAKAALVAAGIKADNIKTAQQTSNDVKAGQVIGTTPSGTVTSDATVTINVSTGPAQVSVPNVKNLTQEAAESQVQKVGLTPNVVFYDLQPGENMANAGKVLLQDPDGGETVDVGSTVTLTVGRAPTTTTTSPSTTRPGTSTSTTARSPQPGNSGGGNNGNGND